jgi:protein-S-isoprenylcysteine O-methyltransferase Ste14
MHLLITAQQIAHWTIYLWFILSAVWLGFAPLAKRTTYRQLPRQRLSHIAPAALGLYLLFGPPIFLDGLHWIDRSVFTVTLPIAVAGFLIALCGIAFSIWARISLDGNWSDSATLKQNHTLTRSGPYRITRHPIYTGILLAILGTALERGLVRSFLAVLFCTLSLWLKIAVEEKLMVQRFGEEYLRYRREIPALNPFHFWHRSLRS